MRSEANKNIDAHRVVHRGWSEREFAIVDPADRTVCRAKLSWYAHRAAFDVEGRGYIAFHTRWNEAALEDDTNALVATAHWSAFEPPAIEHNGRLYLLQREGWGYRYNLYRDGKKRVAGFDRQGTWRRKWLIQFSDELSLAANMFCLWLVVVRWRSIDTVT